MLNEELPLLKT